MDVTKVLAGAGVLCFILGIGFLVRGSLEDPYIGDCFDRRGNKIIGQECIITDNIYTGSSLIFVLVGFGLLIMAPIMGFARV